MRACISVSQSAVAAKIAYTALSLGSSREREQLHSLTVGKTENTSASNDLSSCHRMAEGELT